MYLNCAIVTQVVNETEIRGEKMKRADCVTWQNLYAKIRLCQMLLKKREG